MSIELKQLEADYKDLENRFRRSLSTRKAMIKQVKRLETRVKYLEGKRGGLRELLRAVVRVFLSRAVDGMPCDELAHCPECFGPLNREVGHRDTCSVGKALEEIEAAGLPSLLSADEWTPF